VGQTRGGWAARKVGGWARREVGTVWGSGRVGVETPLERLLPLALHAVFYPAHPSFEWQATLRDFGIFLTRLDEELRALQPGG